MSQNLIDTMNGILTDFENASDHMKEIMNDVLTDVEGKFLSNCSTKALQKYIEVVLPNITSIIQEAFTDMASVLKTLKDLAQDEIKEIGYEVSQIKTKVERSWTDFQSRLKILQDSCTLRIGYHFESKIEAMLRSIKTLVTSLQLPIRTHSGNSAQNILSSLSDWFFFDDTNNPSNNQNHVNQGIENNQDHVNQSNQKYVNQGIENNQKIEDERNLKHTERRGGEDNNGQKDAKEGNNFRSQEISERNQETSTPFTCNNSGNLEEETRHSTSKNSYYELVKHERLREKIDNADSSYQYSESKIDTSYDKGCLVYIYTEQEIHKPNTPLPRNRISDLIRCKEQVKTGNHVQNLEGDVILKTFTLPNHITQIRGQVVVTCSDVIELSCERNVTSEIRQRISSAKGLEKMYLMRWGDLRLDVLSSNIFLVIHILRYFGYIVYLNFTFFATEKISNFKEASDEHEEINVSSFANLFRSKDSGWHSIPERLNNEHADQGRHSEKKETVQISDTKSDSKPEDKKCPSPRCRLQDTPKAETLVPMNRMSNDTRNKENFKTNSHAENLDANVFLFTFTHEALPRYSYHRDMIVDVQNSFKVSVLDGRTPERGQVVVICRDEELRDIQAFISDEQPENIETTSLVKAADMVDCIVLSERVQDCTMKVDRKLKQHFSGRPRRDVQLCILTLNGSPTPRSGLPDGDQHLKYINVPLDTAPIRQFVSSALEMRFLEKLETFKAQQSRGQEKKCKKLKRLLREVETIEKSLKHYSKFNDVSQNENTEIPDAVMAVITKHKMHIQSYGMRKGVIKIRVNQEHYQVVSEDIKSTGIDVDIRSVDITEDPIVPFVRQGCRLIRSDKKYGTLGTFANYTVRSGEKNLVALTCAHVCSRGDKVSVDLNNETKRFGTCIDDTFFRQGSEQAHSDLSIIQIETEMHKNCERRHLYRKNLTEIKETDEAKVCEDLNAAPPGKVHKVGARTGWTHGEIIGYENIFRKENNKFWSYFLVHSNNKSSKFAEGGDSGAVVSTVRFDKYNREHALYLGMVFGGPINNDKLVRALPSDSPPSRPISCREDDENTPHAESMRDDDSIDSMDSSDDIYCTVLQTDLQSLHGDVSFDLR